MGVAGWPRVTSVSGGPGRREAAWHTVSTRLQLRDSEGSERCEQYSGGGDPGTGGTCPSGGEGEEGPCPPLKP